MAWAHKNLANGKWRKLSLNEQIGNIGSEIARIKSLKSAPNAKPEYIEGSYNRALELIDLTLECNQQPGVLKELCRLRELLADTISKNQHYDTTLDQLVNYCLPFAILART